MANKKNVERDNGRLARVMGTAMHLGIETYYNHFKRWTRSG